MKKIHSNLNPDHEFQVVEKVGCWVVKNVTMRQTFDAVFSTREAAEGMIKAIKTGTVEDIKPTPRHAGSMVRDMFTDG